MPSPMFDKLTEAVGHLEKCFLFGHIIDSATKKPLKIAPADYSNDDLLYARAYFTFCHAELEVYFEQKAAFIFDRLKAKWKHDEIEHKAFLAISLYQFAPDELSIPAEPQKQAKGKKVSSLFGGMLNKNNNTYLSSIDGNHGIKKKNIAQLFIPLGIEPSFFDRFDSMLDHLEYFGGLRGGLAHQNIDSLSKKVTDPYTDTQDLKELFHEIEVFDQELDLIF